MNQILSLTTQLTVGSNEIFQLAAFKNGLLWDLTGATILLKMVRPDEVEFSLSPASVYDGGAKVNWTVLDVPGTWIRAWDVTDSGGVRQVSNPITFTVVSSPS
jgi:hypothetical protein